MQTSANWEYNFRSRQWLPFNRANATILEKKFQESQVADLAVIQYQKCAPDKTHSFVLPDTPWRVTWPCVGGQAEFQQEDLSTGSLVPVRRSTEYRHYNRSLAQPSGHSNKRAKTDWNDFLHSPSASSTNKKLKSSSNSNSSSSSSLAAAAAATKDTDTDAAMATDDEAGSDCCICMSPLVENSSNATAGSDQDSVVLCCLQHELKKGERAAMVESHRFHRACISNWFESKGCPLCPTCKGMAQSKTARSQAAASSSKTAGGGHLVRIGTSQPDGVMKVYLRPDLRVPTSYCTDDEEGKEEGKQEEEELNGGTFVMEWTFRDPSEPSVILDQRRAFIPDSRDGRGRRLLERIVKAWERKLLFSVGRSLTNPDAGDNSIIWSGNVHFKTEPLSNESGHGFPDDQYFDRLDAELSAVNC